MKPEELRTRIYCELEAVKDIHITENKKFMFHRGLKIELEKGSVSMFDTSNGTYEQVNNTYFLELMFESLKNREKAELEERMKTKATTP